jgi:hypothetical protein
MQRVRKHDALPRAQVPHAHCAVFGTCHKTTSMQGSGKVSKKVQCVMEHDALPAAQVPNAGCAISEPVIRQPACTAVAQRMQETWILVQHVMKHDALTAAQVPNACCAVFRTCCNQVCRAVAQSAGPGVLAAC